MNFWEELQVHLSHLNAESKQVRRNTMNLIYNETKSLPQDLTKYLVRAQKRAVQDSIRESKDSDDDDDDEDEVITQSIQAQGDTPIPPLPKGLTFSALQELVKPLLSRLFDSTEKCRELSYCTLMILFQRFPMRTVVTFLPQTIPVLLDRLGGVELNENSEEVRYLGVELMSIILAKVGKDLAPFVDDWIQILSVTLVDPYHEVRKISSEVVSESAKTLASVFHYNSERLNKPLCVSITHQQSKVRVTVVQALGNVLLYGSHKCIEDFLPHLTQRLFDPQPKVRKAVVEVIGSWMLDYVDRYSYFHKMLPLIITGLCDECEEVSNLAYKLWEQVGDKYLEENLQEYKDQVDFPSVVPTHYPDDVKRPNFGCRLLIQRNASKIIPGITNDISDWVETTRQKCAQLLFHIILNCESNITMHCEQSLQCIFKSCLDSNPIVSSYVLKSAKLIGYFVPISTSWTILSNRLSMNPNESALAVTASVISGCDSSLIISHFGEITSLVSSSEICRTMQPVRQFWILQLVESLVKFGVQDIKTAQCQEELFRVLLTILALSRDGDMKARALVELGNLKVALEYTSLEELFEHNLAPILTELKGSETFWASTEPENLIFAAILNHGDSAIEKHLDLILDILLIQLDPQKDPEVRLNLFTLLSEILSNYGENICSEITPQIPKLQLFVKTIVEDILGPNLVWRAGKSARALRASATSCLLTVLENPILTIENYQEVSSKIVSGCLSMLEDDYHVNRLLATQCLGRIVQRCDKRVDPDVTHKIYPELLKRLDDEQNDIRISAAAAISRLFLYVSPNYDSITSKSHLDYLINVLVIHLDDEEAEIQSTISETLKIVGALSPSLVIDKCNTFRTKHRSPDNCDVLISHFQSLNI